MLCWFFRLMISDAADSDKRIGAWTRRHVTHCVSCRRFHQSCRLLAESLRSEAAISPSMQRADLGRAQRWHPRRPRWAAVATAACIALTALGGIVLLGQRTKPMEHPLPPTLTVAALRMDLTTAWTRLFETPLITEAQNLSNDTQSGIRFLVSCLDVGPFGDFTVQQIEQSGPPSVQ